MLSVSWYSCAPLLILLTTYRVIERKEYRRGGEIKIKPKVEKGWKVDREKIKGDEQEIYEKIRR